MKEEVCVVMYVKERVIERMEEVMPNGYVIIFAVDCNAFCVN